MSWARHVACTREMRNAYNILVGRDHLEDLGVEGVRCFLLCRLCV